MGMAAGTGRGKLTVRDSDDSIRSPDNGTGGDDHGTTHRHVGGSGGGRGLAGDRLTGRGRGQGGLLAPASETGG